MITPLQPQHFSNITEFGVKISWLKQLWVTWNLFAFLASLLGNLAILLATLKYQVIKLNRVIVMLMEHIAKCDLLLTGSSLSLVTVTMIADKWVFGDTICVIVVYVNFYAFVVSILMMCTLTVFKLINVKFPLKTKLWSKRKCQMVCWGIWLVSFYCPILFLSVDTYDVYFDYRIYSCDYGFSLQPTWKWLKPISFFLLLLLPNLTTITATIMLILHLHTAKTVSRRCGGASSSRGIITVVATAAVFMLSYLPYFMYMIINEFLGEITLSTSR